MSGSPTRWDADLYAANTGHHRSHDPDVLSGVPLPPDTDVLDLGCGVGDFTARLAELVPRGRVLGVDGDPDMVAAARQRAHRSRARFAVCRAQDLDSVVEPASVDLVVSTAVLHWVPAADHPRVLGQVRRVLRPGGWFRAEFGGRGQIAAIRAVLDAEAVRHGGRPAQWYFPTPAEYGNLLAGAGAGFDVRPPGRLRLLHQVREFPDQAAFLGLLRSQVLLAYDATVPADRLRAFRATAEERALAELAGADGRYDQQYVRLDLLASRE